MAGGFIGEGRDCDPLNRGFSTWRQGLTLSVFLLFTLLSLILVMCRLNLDIACYNSI